MQILPSYFVAKLKSCGKVLTSVFQVFCISICTETEPFGRRSLWLGCYQRCKSLYILYSLEPVLYVCVFLTQNKNRCNLILTENGIYHIYIVELAIVFNASAEFGKDFVETNVGICIDMLLNNQNLNQLESVVTHIWMVNQKHYIIWLYSRSVI